MKRLLFVLLALSTSCFAKRYYVDPSSVTITAEGTITKPWKDLPALSKNLYRLAGGDTVFFKRGQKFKGPLTLYKVGTASVVPIVFMPYGPGTTAPIFEYNLRADTKAAKDRTILTIYQCKHVVISGFQFIDETVDKLNHQQKANVGDAIAIFESADIRVTNVDVSLIGNGVLIASGNNTIENCRFQNLRMIVNTADNHDDDYGATGITIESSNNKILKNYFADCWANSYDYIFDGGAIELFRTASNNQILYNTAINCEGFMELGSDNNAIMDNNVVAYNLLINNGRIFWLNASGNFKGQIQNLKFYNNNVIETKDLQSPSKFLIGKSATSGSTSPMIDLRNNIFWVRTQARLLNQNTTSADLNYTCNIFLFSQTDIGLASGTQMPSLNITDVFKDASSVDPKLWNYHLKTTSPFKTGCLTGIQKDFEGKTFAASTKPMIGIFQTVQ